MNSTDPAPHSLALSKALIGTWELTFREDRDASGAVHPDPGLGPHPVGVLVYDATGHFSAQFMMRDRSRLEALTPSASGHNNTRAVGGYDAYFGRYSVDDATGTVTQTLDGALAPDNVGVVVTRRMTVDGDSLELILPTTALDGTSVVRTLRWRRVG